MRTNGTKSLQRTLSAQLLHSFAWLSLADDTLSIEEKVDVSLQTYITGKEYELCLIHLHW